MTNSAWIYSNGSQECERAGMLLKSVYNDFHEYTLDKEFTQSQFQAEFGVGAEYPQVSIGVEHRGTLKETLQYLKSNGIIR